MSAIGGKTGLCGRTRQLPFLMTQTGHTKFAIPEIHDNKGLLGTGEAPQLQRAIILACSGTWLSRLSPSGWEAAMLRRDLLKAIGGAAILPARANAQQRSVPHIGVLWHAGSAEEEAIYLAALQQGLTGLGYIDGKTVSLDHRFPNEQPERFAKLAAELVALKVDILVAVTRPAALAAQQATSKIPIVFVVVADPVGTKLVNSLARPGGNITGLTNIATELSAKRLALFKEAFPRMTSVALLVNANDTQGTVSYLSETKLAATALGLDVQPVEVRSISDFEQACDKIVEGRFEGIVIGPDGLFFQGRATIAQLALKRRLPLMMFSRETVQAGALMSYGPDVRAIFRRTAFYIDKIVKGEKPVDLPVEQPTKFDFLINLATAKALGVELDPLLLTRADEVIE
jgi:putative ABC transport system substrate-binding protein